MIRQSNCGRLWYVNNIQVLTYSEDPPFVIKKDFLWYPNLPWSPKTPKKRNWSLSSCTLISVEPDTDKPSGFAGGSTTVGELDFLGRNFDLAPGILVSLSSLLLTSMFFFDQRKRTWSLLTCCALLQRPHKKQPEWISEAAASAEQRPCLTITDRSARCCRI